MKVSHSRRNGKTPGNLFGAMVQDALMSLFSCAALGDETSLQPHLCWLGQSLLDRVIFQSLELGILGMQFVIPAILAWQVPRHACNLRDTNSPALSVIIHFKKSCQLYLQTEII